MTREIQKYINAIRNSKKREFAKRLYYAKSAGFSDTVQGEIAHEFFERGLGLMAIQAVERNIAELYRHCT